MKNTPKSLEPLAKEARKYKSAKEFVKSIKSADELNRLFREGLIEYEQIVLPPTRKGGVGGQIIGGIEIQKTILSKDKDSIVFDRNEKGLIIQNGSIRHKKIPNLIYNIRIKQQLTEFYNKATKKQGLTRTWDSKAKRWVYTYTKRTKKPKKKQPDTKLSQRGEWLLSGEYKIRGKPKEVRKLGKAVTKGVKKTKKVTEKPKVKAKPKKKKRAKPKSPQRTLFREW